MFMSSHSYLRGLPAFWRLWPLAVALLLGACGQTTVETPSDRPATADTAKTAPRPSPPLLIDSEATDRTRALYRNLHRISGERVLFGHQDALAYGVTWVNEPGRSDVKDVTGSHPAVYGWELGNLALGAEENLDGVNFAQMQEWIRAGHERGAVITLGWHMSNPVTGGDAWDTRPAVGDILPGGEAHGTFVEYLDTLVAFNEGLTATDERGREYAIPVIFRPWHEHNGNWFWWGREHTGEAEYIQLWRFTVEYLRDERGIDNFIYAYSPDRSRIDLDNFREEYLYAYPGDDYVDIIGLDNYWDLGHPGNEASAEEQAEGFRRSLEATVALARAKNKLPALTEGGYETVPDPTFWTETFLAGLNANEKTRQIAYALVWRNANREKEDRDHYYAPYAGQVSAEDFVDFYRHPLTLFEHGLPDLYRAP